MTPYIKIQSYMINKDNKKKRGILHHLLYKGQVRMIKNGVLLVPSIGLFKQSQPVDSIFML